MKAQAPPNATELLKVNERLADATGKLQVVEEKTGSSTQRCSR